HDILLITHMTSSAEGLPRASFLILLALADQPRHGLAILDRVADSTQNEVVLGPGTLYGALHKLAAAGFVRDAAPPADGAAHDARRRYYSLTPRGDRALRAEAKRLRSLVRAAVDVRLL